MSLLLYAGMAFRGVERVRDALEKYRPGPVYIMFSGGKDSALATLFTAEVTDDFVMVFLHIAGQSHRDNISAVYGFVNELKNIYGLSVSSVRFVCKRPGDMRKNMYRVLRDYPRPLLVHAIVTSHSLGLDYWNTLLRYGFPMPLERGGGGKRYCCSEFKSKWFDELPPNTRRSERVLVSGVKKADSSYRKKLWSNYVMRFYKHTSHPDITIAPLVDYTDVEVMLLLKQYNIKSILRQYEKWHRSPNCVLCPLQGKHAFMLALKNLPCSYLKHVSSVLKELLPRYKSTTFSHKKIKEWMGLIQEEMKKRC